MTLYSSVLFIADNRGMRNIPNYFLDNLATADTGMKLYSSVLCIAANRGMRNIPNYFLANLAIADLGMALFNCFPSFLFLRDQ
jgi:hypothetical protein